MLRGQPIPPRGKEFPVICATITQEDDDILTTACNEENYGTEATIKYCEDSQTMIDEDKNFREKHNIQNLQRSLIDMATVIKSSSTNKYQGMIGVAGELHRITEYDNNRHDGAMEDMLDLIKKYTKLKLEDEKEIITEDDDESSSDEERLYFPETGHSLKKREKRIKTCGY